jgi:hypothetical protein
MFRKLRDAVGLGPESRSAFLPYLADKEPDETQAKALAAIVGWPPEPETPASEPEPTRAPDPVAAAIDRQTAVMQALVDGLLSERAADRRRIEDLERTVARLAGARLSESGSAAPTAPRPLAETAG